MKTTGDQHLVKKINKTIVLDTIMKKSPVSRAQISELTGLNKGTVSSLVQELIDENLVREIGTGPSSGGRKPVLLLFNKHAGYAIGADLGVNYLLLALTDLQGGIVREERLPLKDTAVESVAATLAGSLRSLIGSAPASPYGIIGIGIGVPGITDGKGTVLFAPNLGWHQVDLGAIMRRKFACPVSIDNEANMGAMAEKEFGAGRGASDMVYVSIGMGIGTGIVLGRELYRGAHGFAGEMGHTSIAANGRRCSCGNRGCWELYASEKALLEQARSLPFMEKIKRRGNAVATAGDSTCCGSGVGGSGGAFGVENSVGESCSVAENGIGDDTGGACSAENAGGGDVIAWLAELSRLGDPDAVRLLNGIGEYLGVGVANLINTFNPELVVIGNRFTALAPWLSPPLRRVVESRALPFHRRQLKIEFSALGPHATALGAALMAIAEFFSGTKVNLA